MMHDQNIQSFIQQALLEHQLWARHRSRQRITERDLVVILVGATRHKLQMCKPTTLYPLVIRAVENPRQRGSGIERYEQRFISVWVREGLREDVTSLLNDKKVHREALNLVNRHSIINLHCFLTEASQQLYYNIFILQVGKIEVCG